MIRRKEGGGVSDVEVGGTRYLGSRLVHSDRMLKFGDVTQIRFLLYTPHFAVCYHATTLTETRTLYSVSLLVLLFNLRPPHKGLAWSSHHNSASFITSSRRSIRILLRFACSFITYIYMSQ
jgi:hypothetical protein